MKMKRGVLQVGHMVRRVIYLSRDASKALDDIADRYHYTTGELIETFVSEEQDKLDKIVVAVKEESNM